MLQLVEFVVVPLLLRRHYRAGTPPGPAPTGPGLGRRAAGRQCWWVCRARSSPSWRSPRPTSCVRPSWATSRPPSGGVFGGLATAMVMPGRAAVGGGRDRLSADRGVRAAVVGAGGAGGGHLRGRVFHAAGPGLLRLAGHRGHRQAHGGAAGRPDPVEVRDRGDPDPRRGGPARWAVTGQRGDRVGDPADRGFAPFCLLRLAPIVEAGAIAHLEGMSHGGRSAAPAGPPPTAAAGPTHPVVGMLLSSKAGARRPPGRTRGLPQRPGASGRRTIPCEPPVGAADG